MVEAQIYENYPSYKETDNFFMCNGEKINRWKTLEENHITGNDMKRYKIIMQQVLE